MLSNLYLFMNLVLYLLQNNLMIVSFLFNDTLFVCLLNFDCLFEDWLLVLLLCISVVFLTLFFRFSNNIVVRFIYLNIIKPYDYDQSLRLEAIMCIAYPLQWVFEGFTLLGVELSIWFLVNDLNSLIVVVCFPLLKHKRILLFKN